MSLNSLLTHSCVLQLRKRCQKLTYSASTGTPVVGQTVTGSSSLVTAVITRTTATYLVVKTLSGTFTPGETITIGITFSATLGTQTDYVNTTGEPEYYWTNDQTRIKCRFYYAGSGNVLGFTEKGVIVIKPLQVMLPATVTIENTSYRLVTTQTEYEGTYDLTFVPREGCNGLHHYEAVLQKVITP